MAAIAAELGGLYVAPSEDTPLEALRRFSTDLVAQPIVAAAAPAVEPVESNDATTTTAGSTQSSSSSSSLVSTATVAASASSSSSTSTSSSTVRARSTVNAACRGESFSMN
jgi:hypothetical protein